MKKKVILCFLMFIVLLTACSQQKNDEVLNEEKEDSVTISTIPLYVDRQLYCGSVPLCYLNDELMIPVCAIAEDGIENEKSDENGLSQSGEEGNSYRYIAQFDAQYISAADIDKSDDYDYYFFDSKDDKQISIRCGHQPFDYEWTESRTIAHAFGEIDDFTYTNSLDAFVENYEKGHIVFEVDMSLNDRDELLCIHDFSQFQSFFVAEYDLDRRPENYSKEEFLQMKIYGKYITLSIDELIGLMYNYPDIYIVTDTKSADSESTIIEFRNIIDSAINLHKTEVLDRFIPQIHNEKMYYDIMNMYAWKSIIYTSYFLVGDEYSEDRMFEFAYDNGIKVITLLKARGTKYFLEKCEKYGIKTYVHTYNTEEERQELYNKGFYGLYTDYLIPDY